MPRGDRVSRRVFRAHGVGYDVQLGTTQAQELQAAADAAMR